MGMTAAVYFDQYVKGGSNISFNDYLKEMLQAGGAPRVDPNPADIDEFTNRNATALLQSNA